MLNADSLENNLNSLYAYFNYHSKVASKAISDMIEECRQARVEMERTIEKYGKTEL